jgi:hypothetical protein
MYMGTVITREVEKIKSRNKYCNVSHNVVLTTYKVCLGLHRRPCLTHSKIGCVSLKIVWKQYEAKRDPFCMLSLVQLKYCFGGLVAAAALSNSECQKVKL